MTRPGTPVSRRRFLIWAGGAVGASVLACTGVAGLATYRPEIDHV